MRSLFTWIAWVLLAFAAALPGAVSPPGEWYAALSKPDWTPPGWVFPVVWTTLYICMGTGAWFVQRAGTAQCPARVALSLFIVQLALNAAWTPIFFGFGQYGLALVDIVVLWFVLAATIVLFWRVSRPAAALLLPYWAWVTFATALNAAIWSMN